MSVLATYARLVSIPHARSFFVPSALARFGVAMLNLSIFWAVHGARGSYAAAGACAGAAALAEAALAPQLSRLVDGLGQRFIGQFQLLALALGSSGLLLLIGLGAPVWTWAVGSALVGASCPQVGAMAAARWRLVTNRDHRMITALALESGVNEGSFMIGPILVVALSANLHPSAGLVLSWCLITGGTIAVLRCRGTEPATQVRGPGLLIDRRLLTPTFVRFASIHALLGIYFGGVVVCLTAALNQLGVASASGLVAAGGGVCSLLTGFVYGSAARGRRQRRWIVGGALLMAGSLTILSQARTGWAIAGLFILAGGCVAAIVIPAAVVLQASTTGAVYVQAVTWTGSSSALGTAVAAPVTGLVVDRLGWPPAVVLLAVAAAGIAVLALRLSPGGLTADPGSVTARVPRPGEAEQAEAGDAQPHRGEQDAAER